MSWFLQNPPDLEEHNAEVAAVWKAFHEGQPYRVPVSIHGSVRNLIQNPDLNRTGYTFEDFFEDPEAQIQCQLAYQKWYRYHLICDREMGPPQEGWTLAVDFQNSYDAGWFVAISNEYTYPVLAYVSAGIINIFVPSGGGQWAVQGPVLVEAATTLNVSIPKCVMALAYGDQWTNLLQPFWALPLLGLTGLKARQIMGYCVAVMLLGCVPLAVALAVLPA